jgi:hypothetical protein
LASLRAPEEPAPRPSPATIERKLRRQRAQQRAAAAANGEGEDWPALRERLRAAIRDGRTHAEIAAHVGVKRGTVAGWMAKTYDHRAPGPRALRRIRAWLKEGPVPGSAADVPLATRLDQGEQDRLTGFISLESERELRSQFGLTKEVLQEAAQGKPVAAEAIARLRTALANGAAAAE